MVFVLELGERINPGKENESWRSAGFYAGYKEGGPPIIVAAQHDAYKFPNREYAENVRDGDARLHGRIVSIAQ